MRTSELLRLVGQNINQNKFKSIMTSIGIVVGAATIVLVIGIGRGGQMDVAEQFAQLNAGAINISYEYEGEEEKKGGGLSFGGMGGFGAMFGAGGMPQFGSRSGSGDGAASGGGFPGNGTMPDGFPGSGNTKGEDSGDTGTTSRGGFPGNGTMPDGFPGSGDAADSAEASEAEANVGDNSAADGGEAEAEEETSIIKDRLNQEKIILTEKDVQDIRKYISGIRDVTISYSTRAAVEGGQLTDAQTYTLAGVKENYADISKLSLMDGTFFTEEDDEIRSRSCVLGASAAKEIFGSTQEVVGETIYIEDRTYTVTGVFEASATVASNVSTDTAIFVPYETGIKYITGEEIDPIITVIAEDVDVLDSVIEKTRVVLEENYSNAVFTFEDSGSKMQAAKASNRTLTMLLSAMAAIVFFVGGIGIMNVLFVSIKERTNEIGILKAIGMKQSKILLEFLTESAAISFLGGMIGCGISYVLIPVMEHFGIRIETNLAANLTALAFSVLTGTVFGIYPAWKASRLEPVDALNSE